MGYFAIARRSSRIVETVQEGLLSDDSESIFLRTISSIEQAISLYISMNLNNQKLKFKIVTGAAVTAVPKSL